MFSDGNGENLHLGDRGFINNDMIQSYELGLFITG